MYVIAQHSANYKLKSLKVSAIVSILAERLLVWKQYFVVDENNKKVLNKQL